MIQTVGFAVLGQSTVDDIVPSLSKRLPSGIRVLARGALDDLTPAEIDELAPTSDSDYLLVCKVEPGREAQVVFDKMLPKIQRVVDSLASDGADLIVILCGANWSELKSDRIILNPGALLPQLVIALSQGKKLGLVMPTILQVESTKQKYRRLGATNVVATYVTLYDDADPSEEIRNAADFLVSEGVDLVWMPCLGMDDNLRAEFQKQVSKPAVLAQSLLGKVITELIGT